MILQIDLNDNAQKNLLIDFIHANDLVFDEDCDSAFVKFHNDEIIACVCKAQMLLKCLIVSSKYQSQNLSAELISAMINHAKKQNIFTLRVCTLNKNALIFQSLGFRLITSSKFVSLLEYGEDLFESFILQTKANLESDKSYACVVMNANPFSLGHEYLIQQALKQFDDLIVFVVSEDRSFFSFNERFDLVKANLAKYKNVKVLASGEYIISNSTFASYFLKSNIELAHAYLDAKIFTHKIAPRLNIKARFVGTEPLCAVTNAYNQALKECAKEDNLELIEVPRISKNSQIISASLIRQLLENKRFDEAKEYLSEISIRQLLC